MSGNVRLFEKAPDGLLVEVSSAMAAAARAGRRFSSMSVVVDVLWTPEEEATRDAEEAAAAEATQERLRGLAMAEKRRADALARLEARGISAEDLKDALA
jgi:hypothetical protein